MSITSVLRRAVSAPQRALPEAPVPAAPTTRVAERGSFAHATCDECGWRGPGRRARSVAREDGDLHSLTGCGL